MHTLKAMKEKAAEINRHLENVRLMAEAFEIYFFVYEKDWEINIEEFNEHLFHTQDYDRKYRACGPKVHIWDFKRYRDLKAYVGFCENEQYAFAGKSGTLMFGRLDAPGPAGTALKIIRENSFDEHGLDAEKLDKCLDGFLEEFVKFDKATMRLMGEFFTKEIPQFYLSYGGGESGVHHDDGGIYIEFLMGIDWDDRRKYPSGTRERKFHVCRLAVRHWISHGWKRPFCDGRAWFKRIFNGKEKYIRVASFKNFEGVGFELEYEDGEKEAWLYMDPDWTEKQQYLSEWLFTYMHLAWTHEFELTMQLEREWEDDRECFWRRGKKGHVPDFHRWVRKGWYPSTVIKNHVCNPNFFRQVLGEGVEYRQKVWGP